MSRRRGGRPSARRPRRRGAGRKAWRRASLAAAVPWAALAGCAGPAGGPELPSPVLDAPPPGVQAAVEARIQESLPRVSYQRPRPDVFGLEAGPADAPHLEGRLQPEQVRSLIRSLESLDGGGRIVCVPSPGRVFGDCSFPLPPQPGGGGGE